MARATAGEPRDLRTLGDLFCSMMLAAEVTLEGTTVGFESYSADADFAPIFTGLPDDRCQSRHWGVVLKGRRRRTVSWWRRTKISSSLAASPRARRANRAIKRHSAT